MFGRRRRKFARFRIMVELMPEPYRREAGAILDGAPSRDADALIAILEGRPVVIPVTRNAPMLIRLHAILGVALGGDPIIRLDLQSGIDALEERTDYANHGEEPSSHGREVDGRRVDLRETVGKAEGMFQEYERTGQLELLDKSAALFAAVLGSDPPSDIRSAAKNGLGMAKWSRFERFGVQADIDEAIEMIRAALRHVPTGHAVVPAIRSNLAGALSTRWRATGAQADLDDAITESKTAVRETSPDDSRLAFRLNNLGSALFFKATQLSDSSALNESIETLRKAVGRRPSASSGALANLADALRLRHTWTQGGDGAALDEAVSLTEQALAGVGEGTPLGTRFQSNLGVLLLERFMLYGRTQDIERASEALQRAVAATPSQHPNRTERIGALADAHRLQFERRWGIPRLTGHLDALRFSEASHDILSKILSPHARRELKKVVQTAEKAAKVTPAGHHLYARTRMRLAQAQALESVLLRDPRTMRRAHAVWAQVAGDATAAAPLRVRAARYLALAQLRDMMAGSRAADTSIGEFFDLAMELLPRAVPQALPHIDRERHLAMCAGVAHDAAAWVLRRDHPEPEQALGFLEQGRGVLHAQVLNKRTDLTELRARRPELARRFEKLARLLDRPEGAGFTSGWSLETGAASELLTGQDRHALASQWDQLVEEIRSVPGLEHFLQPFQVTELLSAGADEGPIIVINVSGLGCDALIIKDGGVRAVALPMLHAAELVKRADAFVADVRDAGNSKLPLAEQVTAQGRIVETLGWLWTAVTEPILDELGLLAGAAPHSESLPRLWWVPTGHLAYFPLHAAGLAGVPDAQVLDRVVSSYAPTVRELIHARSRPIPQRTPTALIIGMRRTPDAGELPRVPEEVQAITAHFPAARVLMDRDAQRATVLQHLPRYSWAHLACHAVSPADVTSGAHVLLADHRKHPLTLMDLGQLRLDDAELAYLSACETMRAHETLADEALHIAGAFHIAGYRQVVGTLWQVDDEAAQEIAEGFYAAVTSGTPPFRHPARALHRAVRALRDTYPDTPTLWGAHIHVGI